MVWYGMVSHRIVSYYIVLYHIVSDCIASYRIARSSLNNAAVPQPYMGSDFLSINLSQRLASVTEYSVMFSYCISSYSRVEDV